MTNPDNTIRVVIPLTIRKRNGRPRIVAPSESESAADRVQDPRLLRALARYFRQLGFGCYANQTVTRLEEKIQAMVRVVDTLREERKRLEAEVTRLKAERTETIQRLSRLVEKVDSLGVGI